MAETVRTTIVLPRDVLRRAKVKAALLDLNLSELITAALEREISDMSAVAGDDLAWLKLAEPALSFWDNPVDAVFDKL